MSDKLTCQHCGSTKEKSLKQGILCWDHVTCGERHIARRLAALEAVLSAARKMASIMDAPPKDEVEWINHRAVVGEFLETIRAADALKEGE